MPHNQNDQHNPNQYDADKQRQKAAGKQVGDKDHAMQPRDGHQQDRQDDKGMGRKGGQH